jgi:hypothetical protein
VSVHTRHAPSLAAGLADGCPRCAEHAEHPLESLDSAHLRALWERMVGFEYQDDHACLPRTENEARAMKVLHGHAKFLRCIGWSPEQLWAVTF